MPDQEAAQSSSDSLSSGRSETNPREANAEVHFECAGFHKAICAQLSKSEADRLTHDDLKRITAISVSCARGGDIRSLKGIEYFESLRELYVEDATELGSIDLSGNAELRKLRIKKPASGNKSPQIREIDLRSNLKLNELHLEISSLSRIDISKNRALATLHLDIGWGLSEIDLTNNRALTDLRLSNYSGLRSVDLSSNRALTKIDLDVTGLAEIDLRSNTSLTELSVGSMSAGRNRSNAWNSSLTRIDLTGNPALSKLHIFGLSSFHELDVTGNKALTELELIGIKVQRLDLKSNPLLSTLHLEDCEVSEIRPQDNPLLRSLHVEESYSNYKKDIGFSSITEINLTNNTFLQTLRLISLKGIVELDLSCNRSLAELKLCRLQGVNSIDLSQNAMLTKIHIEDTWTKAGLGRDDFSHNTSLQELSLIGVCPERTVQYGRDYDPYTGNGTRFLSRTPLEGVDLGNNTALMKLRLENLQMLNALDLSNNRALTHLRLSQVDGLSKLDLSGNEALRVLWMQRMQDITLVDLRGNFALSVLILKDISTSSHVVGREKELQIMVNENQDLERVDYGLIEHHVRVSDPNGSVVKAEQPEYRSGFAASSTSIDLTKHRPRSIFSTYEELWRT